MAKLTPEQFAAKWASRLGASTQDIQNGINRITVSPTEQAANKQAKMLANLTASVNSGKWARGLRSVSLDAWRKATIEKGLPRIQQGATAAQPKMVEFANKLLPYQQALVDKINAMPDISLQDSIARMTAYINGMAQFKGK